MNYKGGFMAKLWMRLEEKIENVYQIKAPEWVQVDVTKSDKIHVLIVSDQKIDKKNIRNFISDFIKDEKEKYTIGFIDIYSVDKAKEYNIVKREIKPVLKSWADGLNAETKIEEKHLDYNVVSFYSYKGGVGRTIAMIQTAYNLVKAGKKVLLLDLDIEAPSLHNIFSDIVNDEFAGVQYGVIEYLYQSIVQGKKDIHIDDNMYCTIPVENVDGLMYLMPALKKMDKKYVYQIGRLQTEKIQDKNVFHDIFDEIRKNLEIDYILIDTRAGFNQWGSLSLLTLSNQVIFLAYPNDENVEGLNIAFEMMDNIGKSKYAVAMSKVVASDDGKSKSDTLFEKLNISQDSIISIYYNQKIALSNRYPIPDKDVSDAYIELSNYVLDSERIVLNRKYLDNGRKQEILQDLFKEKTNQISIESANRFISQDTLSLLIYSNKEQLYGLRDNIMQTYNLKDDAIVLANRYIFFANSQDIKLAEILLSKEKTIMDKGLEILNTVCHNSSLDTIFKGENIKSVSRLAELLVNKNAKIWAFRGKIDKTKKYESASAIRIFIDLQENLFKNDLQQLMDNMKMLSNYFNRAVCDFQFKFVINTKLWNEYQEAFGWAKTSVTEVQVSLMDIRNLIFGNINMRQFEPYIKLKKSNMVSNESDSMISLNDDNRSIVEMDDVVDVYKLIVGVRKFTDEYSESVEDYIYNFLIDNKNIPLSKLIDILHVAASQEIKDIESSEEKVDDDRVISFNNLNRAMRMISEN